ncbi:MAG: FeoB-associated Cys-rich membrane protein [Deltaproteobacteria bacterium]|nr:FeoB-associated Cys-rich membrane protein [Deltaproteobacteria bacterium]
MWQKITVVLIVILAALYIIRRNWKKFKPGKGEGIDCTSGCESCGQRSGCPLNQQSVIRPRETGTQQNEK